jgi:hypothetical protein
LKSGVLEEHYIAIVMRETLTALEVILNNFFKVIVPPSNKENP